MNNQNYGVYQGGGELSQLGGVLGSAGKQMGGSFANYGQLAQGLFSIIDTIANPPQMMKQPIVNREAAMSMVNPYTNGNGQQFATGGIVTQNLFGNINSELGQVLNQPNIYEEQYNLDQEEEEPIQVEVEDNVNSEEKSFIKFNLDDLTSTESKSLFTSDTSNSTNKIVAKESGGNYGALPYKKDGTLASSAVGKYQFLWNTHKGDIQKITGVKSKEEFRKNPEAQEQYYNYWKTKILEPKAKALIGDIKKSIPSITLDDVEAMIHFAGEGNIKKAIKTGNFDIPLDAFGTTINKYIGKKYAMGGKVKELMYALGDNVPINVEDDEIVETPNGSTIQMNGATHEQGGININVPEGTKIYSDRLKIDGKTMQERKAIREKATSKLDKLLKSNPTDKLLKNTSALMKKRFQEEDDADVELQNFYNNTTNMFAVGGKVPNYETGLTMPELDPTLYADVLNTHRDWDYATSAANVSNVLQNINTDTNPISVPKNDATFSNPDNTNSLFSTGDIIGMAGNLFNAIAPIVNTNKNRAATAPNINRFRGFGQDALDVNTQMQDYIDSRRDTQVREANAQANAQIAANRNNASGVSTARALDIATEINRQKAVQGVEDSFTTQMLNVLGQRTGLLNQRDEVEMRGEAQRDLMDKRDTDAYFSNMAQNLVNAGTNIQGLAKNINKAESNNQNLALLNSLSVNPVAVTKDGRIINSEISADQAAKLIEQGYRFNADQTELIPPSTFRKLFRKK